MKKFNKGSRVVHKADGRIGVVKTVIEAVKMYEIIFGAVFVSMPRDGKMTPLPLPYQTIHCDESELEEF